MTSQRQRTTGAAMPMDTVAGLAELLTVIDGFLHTAHASVSLAAYLRSRGAPFPEHDASTLTDWLSFTAQTFRDLAAGHDGGQHPQAETMPAHWLGAALRACAAGLYPAEAGIGLLIGHGTFLGRGDFTSRFIECGISISDGTTQMADIDWAAAITALNAGDLPCSGGERRILRLAASLAGGIPVDLRDAIPGLDEASTSLLLAAIRHASGKRPATWENS
jgi:hypothetical protein